MVRAVVHYKNGLYDDSDSNKVLIRDSIADKFIDDKLDILDLFGFGDTGSYEFTLRRNIASSPVDNDMMAFLRLVATSGKDSFHLEVGYRGRIFFFGD